MVSHAVSKLVNNPRNEKPECLVRVTGRGTYRSFMRTYFVVPLRGAVEYRDHFPFSRARRRAARLFHLCAFWLAVHRHGSTTHDTGSRMSQSRIHRNRGGPRNPPRACHVSCRPRRHHRRVIMVALHERDEPPLTPFLSPMSDTAWCFFRTRVASALPSRLDA